MKTIIATEDFRVPGTDTLIEKGDKIVVRSESTIMSSPFTRQLQTKIAGYVGSFEDGFMGRAQQIAQAALLGLLQASEELNSETSIDDTLKAFFEGLRDELKQQLGYDIRKFI